MESDSKSFQLVDADSQFTRTCLLTLGPLGASARVVELTQSNGLTFGHWACAEKHNAIVLLLRELNESLTTPIVSEIVRAWQSEYGKRAPDLIVFPGESTIFHLLRDIQKEFDIPSGKTTAVVLPAFRVGASKDLRIELSNSQRETLSKKALYILFVDDSATSRQTEGLALRAFVTEWEDHFEKNGRGEKGGSSAAVTINWFSYIIIDRATQPRIEQNSVTEEGVDKRRRLSLRVMQRGAAFLRTHCRSSSFQDCVFCKAFGRIGGTRRWTVGTRASVVTLIEGAIGFLRPKHIETSGHSTSPLLKAVTRELLTLSEPVLMEAAVRLLLTRPAELPQALGYVAFIALNYPDVAAYLPQERITELFVIAAEYIDVDAGETGSILIALLACLPTSLLCEVGERFVPALAKRGLLNTASAAMALILSSLHAALESCNMHGELGFEQTFIKTRLFKYGRDMTNRVKNAWPGDEVVRSQTLEAFDGDVRSLEEPPRVDSAVWIARTLTSSLQRGRHESYLWEQIRAVTEGTADSCIASIRQVLYWLEQLALRLGVDMSVDINLCNASLATGGREPEHIQEAGKLLIEDVWQRGKLANYFRTTRNLLEIMEQARAEAARVPLCHVLHTTGSRIENPSGEILAWTVFGPQEAVIRSHFRNLLENAIKYFRKADDPDGAASTSETLVKEMGSVPIIRTFLFVDEDKYECIVAVCDRGDTANQVRLFNEARGLANARAHMQRYGGDVVYIDARSELLTCGLSPANATILSNAGADGYHNWFLSRFPLTHRSRLAYDGPTKQ